MKEKKGKETYINPPYLEKKSRFLPKVTGYQTILNDHPSQKKSALRDVGRNFKSGTP